MKNKNAERIWKHTKPTIDNVQTFMKLMYLKAIDDNDEWIRLFSMERQFIRGIFYAESEKYVNEKKPLTTKEGWSFVIDGHAIKECILRLLINNYKKIKKDSPETHIPLEHDINVDAETWANLGLHPIIHEAAKNSYNKGIPSCMNALAKLCNDKTLEFGSPFSQAIKRIFKGIF